MSETIQTKRCPKCKQIKPLSEFNKSKNRKDELQVYCKQCRKQYRQAHKAQRKQYYQAHKAENTQRCFQYYRNHKVEILQYKNQYYKTIEGYIRCLWTNMLQRCNNPKHPKYKWYGGRGIKVNFLSFEDFYDYVINVLKAEPRGLTIDRIDNDGHYEQGNIRFITQEENNKNRGMICLG